MWEDRWEAGRALAQAMRNRVRLPAVAVGIPRGGVVVAAAVADKLSLPLTALVAKKVTPPDQPEFAIGAVTAEGEPVMGIWASHWPEAIREAAIATARQQAAERTRELGPAPDVQGRNVLLIDDGIATGMTTLAAVKALRAGGARQIIIGAPVMSAEAADLLSREADDLIALAIPRPFWAVGAYYRDFRSVETGEVRELLRSFSRGAESA